MRKAVMPVLVLAALYLVLLAAQPAAPVGAQRSDHALFMPVVTRHFLTPVTLNETLRWNIEAVRAPQAWAGVSNPRGTGAGIVVAVLDTGVDLDHPDLQANLLPGRSYHAATPNDRIGHGTHVAGAVAAVANNGGIIGVAPYARIIPVQVLGSNGGTADQVAAGIRFAANRGAHIINMSLGSVFNSSTIVDAVNFAVSEGVLVIAAAGNCGDAGFWYNGCQYRNQPSYPAALGNVVAVAATNSFNGHASFSTQGNQVELAAPGDTIYSTFMNGQYRNLSGTSMASPHVAGVAALLWSYDTNLGANAIRIAMRETAIDLGTPGKDIFFGYGLVNTQAALNALAARGAAAAVADAPTAADQPTAVDPFSVPAGEYVVGELLVKPTRPLAAAGSTAAQAQTAERLVLQAAAAQGVDVLGVERLDAADVLRVYVAPGDEAAAVAALNASDGVVYAELNIILRPQ